jgi:DNA mismatch endonuclease, patch repair protein
MADVFTVEKRSLVMAAIRGRGNKDTEVRLMRLFRLHKIAGWRRHMSLPGRPDFTFPKLRLAVFVDGCFWHACPKHFKRPQSSPEFWDQKIGRNRARDRAVNQMLRQRGWTVLRIWEHALSARNSARTMARVCRIMRTHTVIVRKPVDAVRACERSCHQ